MCLVHLLGPPSLAQTHFSAFFNHTLPLLECQKKFPQMVVQSLLPLSHRIYAQVGHQTPRFFSLLSPIQRPRGDCSQISRLRLFMSNISPNGDLNNDSFLRALLQLCNTPVPDCDLSPAKIVFGHPFRNAFSYVNRLATFSNRFIRRT